MFSRIFLLAAAARAAIPPASFDCAFRQFVVDHAATLQPFRDVSLFQAVADALNGAVEAQNCSVAPAGAAAAASASRFVHRALPRADAPAVFYVDTNSGSDSAAGTITAPFATIERGLVATRAAAPTPGTLILRAGTFYLAAPLELGADDAGLTITSFPGEAAWLSGGRAVSALAWTPVNTTPGAWSAPFQNTNAVVAAMPGPHIKITPNVATAAACEALCRADTAWGCNVYTWHDSHQGGYALDCYERNDGAWSTVPQSGHVSGFKSPNMNVWSAKLPSDVAAVTGLRHADGSRATRARYPNGFPETEGFGSSLYASDWLCEGCETRQPSYQYEPALPFRNTSAGNWFHYHQAGVGGGCDVFDPPAGFWCGNATMGGGAFTYRVPHAMVVTTKQLPHLPYANPETAIVQTWRPGHWASWMMQTGNVTTSGENYTFNFAKGGFQGGRGANGGGEIYVENVLEELDAPDEWYYDEATQTITWFYNATSNTVPPPSVTVTSLQSLVRVTGTAAAPARGVTLAGIGLRDTAYSYMESHGMPSGGDVSRRAQQALCAAQTSGPNPTLFAHPLTRTVGAAPRRRRLRRGHGGLCD